ncbi:MAG: hypothetical protein ACI4TV_00495, partial [Paludibacteraceae bacterium]
MQYLLCIFCKKVPLRPIFPPFAPILPRRQKDTPREIISIRKKLQSARKFTGVRLCISKKNSNFASKFKFQVFEDGYIEVTGARVHNLKNIS